MIIAIIQARMGSTRFPGKVLKEVEGKPLLKYQIERVTRSRLLDKTVVATSTSAGDDAIADLCQKEGIAFFRGQENDVLSRYDQCARQYGADVIVRLTADCPLSDPAVIDRAVAAFKERQVDYLGNTVPVQASQFPDGSDVEVFSRRALERASRECRDEHDREHVTFYFWRHDNGFKTSRLENDRDLSDYRFTVDYPQDFEVVRFIIRKFREQGIFGRLDDIIRILDDNPEIKEKNAMYYAGMGWRQ